MNDVVGICDVIKGEGPVVAAAIHDGHAVRNELKSFLKLTEPERLREEDPFTGNWTEVGDTRVVGLRSRFEVDLNRPREKAVYLNPEDAWGLEVWNDKLPEEIVQRSLGEYDSFYAQMHQVLSQVQKDHQHFVVLDIHTYNHMREGPDGPPADAQLNPEVNIGTGSIDRQLWAPIVDGFMEDLSRFDYSGRHLDVRENVKFQGGQFSRWVNATFPKSGCAVAIEFKKIFMDEWSGEPDKLQVETISDALMSTIPGIRQVLSKL